MVSAWETFHVKKYAPRALALSAWHEREPADRKQNIQRRAWKSGRYFIYDYYYVPKHTYYYCTIYNTIHTPNQHHTLLYINTHPYAHHMPLLHTIYPYTTPYTPIYPYTIPYTPLLKTESLNNAILAFWLAIWYMSYYTMLSIYGRCACQFKIGS